MKREISPALLVLSLALGCIVLRLLNNALPQVMPNASPMLAVAFAGAMFLPRAWGWLVGPATFLATGLAFTLADHVANGPIFSSFSVFCALFYAGAGLLGVVIAQHKTLGRIVTGSLVCSLLFYVVANTISWYELDYAKSWAGWWQANTTGLPGYLPTWHFLRNAAIGDLLFVLLIVGCLEPSLFAGRFRTRTAPQAA
jgi:hypothetical protein